MKDLVVLQSGDDLIQVQRGMIFMDRVTVDILPDWTIWKAIIVPLHHY